MDSRDTQLNKKGRTSGPLVRRLVLIAGVLTAEGLLLVVAFRYDPPVTLLILFILWVFSPFCVYILLEMFATRWPTRSRLGLDSTLAVFLSISLATYAAAALGPLAGKAVPIFVIVPPVLSLLVIVAFGIIALTRFGASSETDAPKVEPRTISSSIRLSQPNDDAGSDRS